MKFDYETIKRNMFINDTIEDYKKFMKITSIPKFQLELIDNDNLIRDGYGVPAEHFYDVSTNKHILKIWKDIYKLNADYIIFHELTHIYDTSLHSAGNKLLYASNRGYLEYHAAQVELLKLVKASTINSTITFSLHQVLDTISGKRTVLQFINAPHIATLKIIQKPNYPNSHEEVRNSLGMIFNYLGCVSICKMYAIDYLDYAHELNNIMTEKKVLGDVFFNISNMLTGSGFLDENEIKMLGEYYLKLILELCDKFI